MEGSFSNMTVSQQLLEKKSSLRPTQTTVKTAPVGTAEDQEQETSVWFKNKQGKWELAAGPHPGSVASSGYTKVNRDEFEDTPVVLAAKIKVLASMIRQAKFPIAYTGAGISTESGIPDYATGSSQSVAKQLVQHVHAVEAAPSDAHLVLARLHSAGLMKAWVQQNHDGLPQKAGFPQSEMNEIHGAWFDPSNPVVPMSGDLRPDLFESLIELENKADFCICVGTSLSGMNADRAAITPGEKAKQEFETAEEGPISCLGALSSSKRSTSPGLVIINLQRTQNDNLAALRIFAKASTVLNALAKELALPALKTEARDAEIEDAIAHAQTSNGCCTMPYSPVDGSRVDGKGASKGFVLDLREGSVVRISRGKFAGDSAVVGGRNRQGHFRLTITHDLGEGKVKAQVPALMGKWWVLEGMRGTVPVFPLIPAAA